MKFFKQVDKMGVLILVSHLIITLAILSVYALFAYMGKPLTTIENMLLVIVGYWFGSMGAASLRKPEVIAVETTKPTEQDNSKGA